MTTIPPKPLELVAMQMLDVVAAVQVKREGLLAAMDKLTDEEVATDTAQLIAGFMDVLRRDRTDVPRYRDLMPRELVVEAPTAETLTLCDAPFVRYGE